MSSEGDRFMAGKEMVEEENGRILFNELSLLWIIISTGQRQKIPYIDFIQYFSILSI